MSPAVWCLMLASSLDHVIRPDEDGLGEREAEGLGGLEVEDQIEARGLLYGQVGLPLMIRWEAWRASKGTPCLPRQPFAITLSNVGGYSALRKQG